MKVRIGRVTTAKRFRLHLDIDGRARCGSGNGRIIPITSREPRPVDEPLVCRRCLPHLRAAIAQAQAEAVAAASNAYRESEVQRLVCLADALEPADERDEMAVLRAQIIATMEHTREVMEQPVQERPRSWRVIRDEIAEHNQPTLFAA